MCWCFGRVLSACEISFLDAFEYLPDELVLEQRLDIGHHRARGVVADELADLCELLVELVLHAADFPRMRDPPLDERCADRMRDPGHRELGLEDAGACHPE